VALTELQIGSDFTALHGFSKVGELANCKPVKANSVIVSSCNSVIIILQ